MDESIIDKALAMLGDDMDGLEGKSAMAHGMDECPNPLTCDMHDTEVGDSLSGLDKPSPALTIEVHGAGMSPASSNPIEAIGDGDGDGLKEDEAEMLRKLLR